MFKFLFNIQVFINIQLFIQQSIIHSMFNFLFNIQLS